jgi:hypothetical protein
MGRAISITASFSGWVRGQGGAIATAGVIIASAVVEAEGTSLVVDTAVDMLMHPIEEVGVGRPMVLTVQQRPMLARPMVPTMPQQRVVAHRMPAAADRMLAVRIVAADITRR